MDIPKSTSEKIVAYISKNGQASGKELTNYLETITSRAVRKQLKSLLDKQVLRKIGRPPKVFYSLSIADHIPEAITINKKIIQVINEHYLYISPTGQAKYGWEGFLTWAQKTKQNPEKAAQEYAQTILKFNKIKKNNLVDGMPKIRQTFTDVYMDKLYYLDFYSIERFGKTKLGQMLLYAKQSQNISLIRKLVKEIRPQILKVIDTYAIDGVLFIPPTVKREVQFMKLLEELLHLPIRTLSVSKVKTEIIVPQKTLTKLEDRIENAKQTIVVEEIQSYKNILLIDDAVGSGATLNETAKQIRNKKIVKKSIIGLAITGSFKGFDVISEV